MTSGFQSQFGGKAYLREAYSRQSARALVIDCVKSTAEDSIGNLTGSITDFFSIVCSLRGSKRLPAVSLLLSWNKADVLLPMQKVGKPLYDRIKSCLDRISSSPEIDRVGQTTCSLEQALVLAVNDFRKFKELSGFSEQLEITVFTYKTSQTLESFGTAVISSISSDNIKRIEFVSLTSIADGIFQHSPTDDALTSPTSEDHTETSCMWNILRIEPNSVSIQCHLRSWLKDECSDREHLQVEVNDLRLKCDMQQTYIVPDEFPFRHSYFAVDEFSFTGMNGRSQAHNKPEAIPLLRLRAKAIVNQDGVCDSLVFGTSAVLVPSSCWRMEWEELDNNRDRFCALCRTLQEQKKCILCQNVTQYQNRQRNYGVGHASQPTGLFIVLPSNTSSLLLKAVVPRELYIPIRTDALSEKGNCPASAMEEVRSAVESLEKTDVYNPLNYSCGLYENLDALLLPKSTTKLSKGSKQSSTSRVSIFS